MLVRATPRSSRLARSVVSALGLLLVVVSALVSADSSRRHDQEEHDQLAQLRAHDRAEAVARVTAAGEADAAALVRALADGYAPGPIRLIDVRTGTTLAIADAEAPTSPPLSPALRTAALARPDVAVAVAGQRAVSSRVVVPASDEDWAVLVPIRIDALRLQDLLTRDSVAVVAIGLLLLLVVFLNAGNARRAAARAALIDPLTGVRSRLGIVAHIDEAFADRRAATTVCVIQIELDGLPDVHGTLGHVAAAELLRRVARRLVVEFPSVEVARLDGGSFALACTDLADPAEALAFAEMVRESLHEPFELDGLQLGVDADLGVVLGPDHGLDGALLLRRADLAAQRARAAHDPVVLFERSFDSPTPERLALVAELRRAIDNDELLLNYQPIVHMLSGEVVAFEALVRWRHPTRGVIPPVEFVPLAERTALVHPLTAWVLDEAMRQSNAWCEAGTFVPIAINVSARCLDDESFADAVEETMTRWNVPSHLLEIELTESAVMDDPARARRVLGQLHRLGVNIAIDDFGTGYSSLAYLQSLPVDMLKIDATFVQQLGHRPGEGTIVRSIVALARTLGLQVIAEGVDDDKALRFLVETGCDLGQGYRWAQPMDGEAALAMVRACSLSSEPSAGSESVDERGDQG